MDLDLSHKPKNSFQLPPISEIIAIAMIFWVVLCSFLLVPTWLIDIFLTINIAIAITLLCVSLDARPFNQKTLSTSFFFGSLLRCSALLATIPAVIFDSPAGEIMHFSELLLGNPTLQWLRIGIIFLLAEAFIVVGIGVCKNRLPNLKGALQILRLEALLLLIVGITLFVLYQKVFPVTMPHLFRPPLLMPNPLKIIGTLSFSQLLPLFITSIAALFATFKQNPQEEPEIPLRVELNHYPYALLYAGYFLLLIAISSPFTHVPWWTFLPISISLLLGSFFTFFAQDVQAHLDEQDRLKALIGEAQPKTLDDLK